MDIGQGNRSQLELGIQRQREMDRNHRKGGRSFYFFDFDDNIAHLATPLVIFDKNTREEQFLSSLEWATHHMDIGKSGLYKNFLVDFNEQSGSFRYFRDHSYEALRDWGKNQQFFVEDVLSILRVPDFQWKGPSWDCFYHAIFNQRPISLITARGHGVETLKAGIRVMVEQKILPLEPNYLSIYPVSRPETRLELGDGNLTYSTAELKQKAIRSSVLKAFEIYGYNKHHRFGMSDDDPKNIQLIYEEMKRLKSDFSEVSFFLIETNQGGFVKHEVHLSGTESWRGESLVQLTLFDNTQA